MSAIEKGGLAGRAAKDDEFYLGVLCDGELWDLYHVMAGGPSRGTMAHETETAPGEGTSVQLLHRPSNHDDIAPAAVQPGHAKKNTLSFVALPQVGDGAGVLVEEEEGDGDDWGVTVLENTFVDASENGFMLSRRGEMTWTCIAHGAQAYLTW